MFPRLILHRRCGQARRRRAAVGTAAVAVERLESRLLLAVQLASWSDAFVNSIGINSGTTSAANCNTLLAEIGIRNVRGLYTGISSTLRGAVMVHPYRDSTGYLDTSATGIANTIASIKSTYSQSQIEAVEGPDEYDSSSTNHHGDDPNWTDTLRTFDAEMDAAMRADPWFNGIPYIGTSVAFDWNMQALGDESAFVDGGNAHDYAGLAAPGTVALEWQTKDQGYVIGGLPVWSTESGYSTGNVSGSCVDQTVQARYYPRIFLDHFNIGDYRTFAYDLNDKTTTNTYDGTLGIVDYDQQTLKPAAIAIENLISILQDPQSTPFDAGGLDYTITGAASDVQHTLLEKKNGTFELVLWRDVTNNTDTLYAASNTTLTFNTPVAGTVTQFTPNVSAAGTTLSLGNNAITIPVTDQVTIIQITPASTPAAPAAPSGLVATTAGAPTRVTLTWTDHATNEDGYLIERLNQDENWYTIGTVPAGVTTFTDINAVPGKTYGYRVTAVNRGGGSTAATTTYTAPAAGAIADPLANFNYTTGNIDGQWSISTAANGGTDDDANVANHADNSDSLIYNDTNIEDFTATVYLKNVWPNTDAALAISSNGSTYTPVSVTYAANGVDAITGYGFNVLFIRPVSPLPAGTNYLKITLTAGTGYGANEIELGNMKLILAPPLSAALHGVDIGFPLPSLAGSSTLNGSTWTVNGSGAAISGSSDQFQYADNTNFSGNGSIIADVASLTNTGNAAEAGVMLRDTASAQSLFADVVITYAGGIIFQWRSGVGSSASSTTISGITAPRWVKLTRSGNVYTAYDSGNGTSWTQIGSPQTLSFSTVAMGNSSLAGLAVTSGNNSSLCTGTFTNVSINNPTVATAPAAAVNPATGTSANLSVQGADPAGAAGLTYTWATAGTPPAAVTFTGNGTNTAQNTTANFAKAGNYTVQVTIADAAGYSTIGTLPITVIQTPGSIAITPAGPINLSVGATQQFTATVYDQFAAAISPQPTIAWSLGAGGIGNLSSTAGLYTAPASIAGTSGIDTVTATVGNASTAVTVNLLPAWLAAASQVAWNQRTQTLTVTGNATLTADPNTYGDAPIITVGNSSHVTLATATAHIASLTLASATLDIAADTLFIHYGNGSSPLAMVQSAVGNGTMISSTANAGKAGQFTVGFADSTEVGAIPSGNVEVMYALAGDTNLNATVNFNDYSTLQNNYNQTGRDWAQGDFNHDGTVNFNDYSMLQNNYNQSAGTVFSAVRIGGNAGGSVAGAALHSLDESNIASDSNGWTEEGIIGYVL